MGSESGELNVDDQMIGGDLKTCPSRREKLVHAVYRYSMMFFCVTSGRQSDGWSFKALVATRIRTPSSGRTRFRRLNGQ